jgi:signal transduction histidine kinase
MQGYRAVTGTGAPRRNWRNIALGAIAAFGIAMLVTLVAMQSAATRERDHALKLQSHSYEVMILARALSSSMAQAEASLGRYVISAEPEMGRAYYEQWSQAGRMIDRLARETRDNPDHQASIATLRTAYRERGQELTRIGLYTAKGRNGPAFAFYNTARNSPSLGQLGTQLRLVTARERALLASRSSTAAVSVERSNAVARTLALLTIPLVLGALLLGWMALRSMRERGEADAEAEAERERSQELEAAVTAATAKLKEEARERAQAEAQLRQVQKMEAVGQLTGGIAHDFNNMLAVVLGGLELAKRHLHKGGPDAARHIENAMEGANRAAALTRRLLAFARAEPLLPESVEASVLIGGMTDLLDRTLGDAISVETRDSGQGGHVWVDRHQLENAILNLAVNARDAMDGRGALTILTGGTTLAAGAIGECAAGEYVTIAVQDTGCGMDAEVLERVFEPFFTTKPVGKGTGLGLSQIFGLVRQSDGEIGIESAPGAGTTVTLYLPRHDEALAGPEATDRLEPRATLDRTLDILVVEDDPRVLGATMAALRELGHRPIACEYPLEAPGILDQIESLDLIVSDVLMPGQTGPEMIAALRPRLHKVGVLFVTGYSGDIADTGMFGGHQVLRKPYTISGLERAVAEAMRAVT